MALTKEEQEKLINNIYNETVATIEPLGYDKFQVELCINKFLDAFLSLQSVLDTNTVLFGLKLTFELETQVQQAAKDNQ